MSPTDRQTDRQTLSRIELLLQLKTGKEVAKKASVENDHLAKDGKSKKGDSDEEGTNSGEEIKDKKDREGAQIKQRVKNGKGKKDVLETKVQIRDVKKGGKGSKSAYKLPTCKFHDLDKSKQGSQLKTMTQGTVKGH